MEKVRDNGRTEARPAEQASQSPTSLPRKFPSRAHTATVQCSGHPPPRNQESGILPCPRDANRRREFVGDGFSIFKLGSERRSDLGGQEFRHVAAEPRNLFH